MELCPVGLAPFKCVQKWGMTLGSGLSIACILVIVVDCIRFKELRSFTRRPVAPLLFRSLCNFIFCAQFMVAHIFLQTDDSDGSFPTQTCRNLAFITQFTLLASECWYFVISLDVAADVFLSPFNNMAKRMTAYHIFVWGLSGSTAVALVTTGEAGNSDFFAWCWRKSFGSTDDTGFGFLYLYGEVVFFYTFSLITWFLARMTLSKGIPRTYKVRETRIRQGKGIVVGFTVYWTIFGSFYSIILFAGAESERTTGGWIAIWFGFSFMLCARGVADFLVWTLCVKQTELDFSLRAFCCGGCRRTVRRQDLSAGLLDNTNVQTQVQSGLPADDSVASFDDVGLNSALREELLFWTMLGLRTAVQVADQEQRTSDPELGHGRTVDVRDIDLRKAVATDAAVKESIRTEAARHETDSNGMDSNSGTLPAIGMIDLDSAVSKSNVRFRDYCPSTFLSIRTRYGITLDSYQVSMSRHANAHFSVGGGGSG